RVPAAAAFGATEAAKVKVTFVTHGDTASFWSVFKKGVDQATKDLKSYGLSVTQTYDNNDYAKQANHIDAAVAAKVNVIVASAPNPSALKGALTKASQKGIEIITANSGLGAFHKLPTYMRHLGQAEAIASPGADKQIAAD